MSKILAKVGVALTALNFGHPAGNSEVAFLLAVLRASCPGRDVAGCRSCASTAT